MSGGPSPPRQEAGVRPDFCSFPQSHTRTLFKKVLKATADDSGIFFFFRTFYMNTTTQKKGGGGVRLKAERTSRSGETR